MAVSKKVATISAIASVVIAISIASMKINAKTEKTVVVEEKKCWEKAYLSLGSQS